MPQAYIKECPVAQKKQKVPQLFCFCIYIYIYIYIFQVQVAHCLDEQVSLLFLYINMSLC